MILSIPSREHTRRSRPFLLDAAEARSQFVSVWLWHFSDTFEAARFIVRFNAVFGHQRVVAYGAR